MQRLEIDTVSKRYGDVVALDRMAFEVAAGEIFGFVGSNGAGKTTTMRIILGVLAADAGTVRWAGREIDLDTRRRIGYMPEERGLYPRMKVGQQLAYLARLHGLDAAEASAAVERWTTRLGVSSRIGDDVQKLSLGNQQRVQLAAALIHEPDVLVLDEPFSGLDPVAVDVMSQIVGYVIGISVLPSDPSSQFVEILSVIPVFAPTLMPMRLAIGGVPLWETALAVVLALAMIPLLIALAGRVYRNAVVRSGARVRLSDALRAP